MILMNASLEFNTLRKYYYTRYQKPHVLLSMALLRDPLNFFSNRQIMGSLNLDSGTYSVNQGRSDLTENRHIQYLKVAGDKFDGYFSFDVDFS